MHDIFSFNPRGPYCTCIPGQSTLIFGVTVPGVSHRELLENSNRMWAEQEATDRYESVAGPKP